MLDKRCRNCYKCGCKDIYVKDYGYSTFNVATAHCTRCKYTVEAKCVSWIPDLASKAAVDAWNKKSDAELLTEALATIELLREKLSSSGIREWGE